jgi:hypothetical protein
LALSGVSIFSLIGGTALEWRDSGLYAFVVFHVPNSSCATRCTSAGVDGPDDGEDAVVGAVELDRGTSSRR